MIVIPAINAATREEAEAQFKKIAPLGAELIHLDIADGKFAPNTTWGTPDEVRLLVAKRKAQRIYFEVHLMIENPEAVIEAWLKTGLVKRAIVHVEAIRDTNGRESRIGGQPIATNKKVDAIRGMCKKYGAELMLAARPETPAATLLRHADGIRAFQILAVPPGKTGVQFLHEMYAKIRFVHACLPHAKLEVDGGITPDVARKCKDAGADIVVSGWYIRNAVDPQKAYEALVASG